MMKSALLAAITQELRRHDLSHFTDEENKDSSAGLPNVPKGVLHCQPAHRPSER